MTPNKIITKIFHEYDITMKEFCKEADIKSQTSLHNWINDNIPLSYDRLFLILDNLKIKYKIEVE